MKFSSVLAILALSVIVICQAADGDVVVYIPFDEGNGDKISDPAPNGLTGDIADAEWVDGVSGKALEFSGGYALVEPLEATLEAFTIEFWFKPSDGITSASGRQDVVYGGGAQGRPHLTFNRKGGGELGWAVNDGASSDVLSETKQWDAEWYHVAATQDASSAKLYINGDLEAETAMNGPPTFGYIDGGILIGGGLVGHQFAKPYMGAIDELRFWDSVLTKKEIQAIMEGPQAVDLNGKLVTLWGEIKSVSP